MGWVTVSGFNSRGRHFISVCNQPPRSTQPSTLSGTVKWVPAKGRWCSAAGETPNAFQWASQLLKIVLFHWVYRHHLMHGSLGRPERKRKEKYFYSAIYTTHSLKELWHRSHSFTCKLHYACLSFVCVLQMAPPLTEVADIQLQLTTHLSTQTGWKAELVDL